MAVHSGAHCDRSAPAVSKTEPCPQSPTITSADSPKNAATSNQRESSATNPSISSSEQSPLSVQTDEELRRLIYSEESSCSNDNLGKECEEDTIEPNLGDRLCSRISSIPAPDGNCEPLPADTPVLSNGDELNSKSTVSADGEQTIELRLLVRRREAGALIGKRGANIKRLRDSFRGSVFSIPDTGNGPERIVCIATEEQSIEPILTEITQLFMEKSPENEEQIEMKLLIHSSHAGSIIGIGGQSIKKLRNDSKAAIKIYEMCCPLSNERVCAIKAKPPVVVSTIRLIQSILNENPTKGTIKPYDALHFDLNLVNKYGGYLPDETLDILTNHNHYNSMVYNRQVFDAGCPTKHYPSWRPQGLRKACEMHGAGQGRPSSSSGTSCMLDCQAGNTMSLDAPSNHSNAKITHDDSLGIECSAPECRSELEVAQSNNQSVRVARFHPYAPMVRNPFQFATCDRPPVQHQVNLNDAYSLHPRFHCGPMQYRNQFARTSGPLNMLERCHHARPCPCMFMPMAPDTLLTPPSVHLSKTFNHQRNSPFGQRKK